MHHKFGDDVTKNFTLDAVKGMKLSIYDEKTGKVASPMDAYIAEVKDEDKELNLEKEVAKEKEGKTNSKNTTMRPSPEILQQQMQIHNDDTVSTFREK